MRIGSRPPVLGIAAETLDFAREAARDAHPNEYLGILQATPAGDLDGFSGREGVVITDILVIPGTKSGPTSATMKRHLVPNDNRTVGSVHSHPNGVLRPSDEDRSTFGAGVVHVILGAPYGPDDWRSFDSEGERRSLSVLDVDLPDPESFFDFTQEDIDREL
ncbi:MAG: Mov34/MPN/PAD-1 family protein [Halobacteriota archaeon]|uniref:Mov34/MPN/PAD-1 family protein n=1 Tax=Halanaeroarchaeum sp. HSR-CO TaxID=2866382 RepID=UPI00217CFCF5|nr:Mov34/MPN/PAD-1 family protein [Halanaeroarchaeum sp. HSR-CO]UWG47690.1 Proteasome lid subunit RPN8/RPN11, contains Jab1/MPN domain metalloenzyme (JAMM) motif [Halanaeroarchaeum sp. HSR-CO]